MNEEERVVVPTMSEQKEYPCPPWMHAGARVRSTVEFSGVPKGTVGLVLSKDGTGFPVAWDLPHEGHVYSPAGSATFVKPLVDWFNNWEAAQFLEPVE